MQLRLKGNSIAARLSAQVDLMMIGAATTCELYSSRPGTVRARAQAMEELVNKYIHFLEKHFHDNSLTEAFKAVKNEVQDLGKAVSTGTLGMEAADSQLERLAEKVNKAMEEFKNA